MYTKAIGPPGVLAPGALRGGRIAGLAALLGSGATFAGIGAYQRYTQQKNTAFYGYDIGNANAGALVKWGASLGLAGAGALGILKSFGRPGPTGKLINKGTPATPKASVATQKQVKQLSLKKSALWMYNHPMTASLPIGAVAGAISARPQFSAGGSVVDVDEARAMRQQLQQSSSNIPLRVHYNRQRSTLR